MQIPSKKEISRFAHGYISGLMACSVITLVVNLAVVAMGFPLFFLWVETAAIALSVIVFYWVSRIDKDDIPMEIAMYKRDYP